MTTNPKPQYTYAPAAMAEYKRRYAEWQAKWPDDPKFGPWPEAKSTEWYEVFEAPVGTIWVCGACGRTAQNPTRTGDESCFLHSILCTEGPSDD